MCTQSQLDLNKYLPVSETLAALSCIFNWNLSGLFLRAISEGYFSTINLCILLVSLDTEWNHYTHLSI